MSKKRLLAIIATVSVSLAGATAALLPMTASNAAAGCVAAYNNSAVYTGGMTASYNSHNWTAKWWTQYEAPSTGGSTTCNYPNWVAGQYYNVGAIVKYTNGQYYQASHENPGYDPVISTWF